MVEKQIKQSLPFCEPTCILIKGFHNNMIMMLMLLPTMVMMTMTGMITDNGDDDGDDDGDNDDDDGRLSHSKSVRELAETAIQS